MQFRVGSFNAFNHPNFQIPVDLPGDSDVGRVTGAANEGCEWQFALKRIF